MDQQQSQLIQQFQSDKVHFRTLIRNFGKILVFVFVSEANKESQEFLDNLKNSIPMFGQYDNVKYFSISAEKCPETFQKYEVEKTPTVIITQTNKKIHHKHQDQNIGMLFDILSSTAALKKQEYQKLKPIFFKKCQNLVQSSPIIIFMKGTPTAPKCGFVRQLLQILTEHNLHYNFYDIIADQDIRNWQKQYSGCATFPQIFVEGKLIGGLDAMKQIVQKGELKNVFPAHCFKASAQQRLEQYLKDHNEHRLIFIDGFPFEQDQSDNFIQKNQNKSQDEYIWNVGLDQQMKEAVQNKFKKPLPFIVEKSQLVN